MKMTMEMQLLVSTTSCCNQFFRSITFFAERRSVALEAIEFNWRYGAAQCQDLLFQ